MNKDTKIIKTICVVIATISAIIIIGLLGGFEQSTVDEMAFIKCQLISCATLGLSLLGTYYMEEIEQGRCKRGKRENF